MPKLISLLLTTAVFLLLFAGFFHPIDAMDQDLGRHLLMGDIILSTQNVPKTNLLAYTYPDFPFINHHWGAEVAFSLIFNLGGFNLLQVFSTVLFIGAFGLVFWYSLKKGHILTSGFASMLFLPILLGRTDIRPELFSFLFLSLFIVILYKYREKRTKWIFALPIIQLLWINIHIYAVIGAFVMGLFLLDGAITRFSARKKLFDSSFKTLISVFLTTCAATIVNPNGVSGALYPLRVFQNYGYTIQENQSVAKLLELGFPMPTLPYLSTSILLLFIFLFMAWHKTKPVDWLLAISFSALSLMAIRNFPLFVFAAFIPFCTSLSQAFEGVSLDDKPIARRLSKILPFAIVGILLWQTASVINQKSIGIGAEISADKAADFYIEQGLLGPLFNNFDIGSYLTYRLYPKDLPAGRQGKVFIDGRPEAYPASFLQQTYIPMQESPEVFAKTDAKYKFNTIFFSHTDQTPWAKEFLPAILDNKDWITIYLDDTVIILVKKNEVNKELIEAYGMEKSEIVPQNVKKSSLKSLIKLANFYNTAGLTEQEIGNYKDLLKINPTHCLALQNLTILLSEKNDPEAQVYTSRFQQSCQ